jgi:hypothetical protein
MIAIESKNPNLNKFYFEKKEKMPMSLTNKVINI